MQKKIFVVALVASVSLVQACSDKADPIEIPDGALLCEDGSCQHVLDPSEISGAACDSDTGIKCDGNSVMACISGGWKTVIECPYGCENNTCILPECTAGTRCDSDGKNVQSCVDGFWKTENECDFACKDSACICDVEAAPFCDGETLISCADGALESRECPNGCVEGACVAECEPSTSECADEKSLRVCSVVGFWEEAQNCEFGCADDACVICAEQSTKCSDDSAGVLICSNNEWKESTACELGCKDGQCLGSTCENEGELRCLPDEITLQICEDGHWMVKETCKEVCSKSECIAKECNPGESSCDDKGLVVCEDYRWQEPVKCEFGCGANGCLECDPENSDSICMGDRIMTCSEGTYKAGQKCDFGCSNGVCNECADSAPVCSEDGTTLISCDEGKKVEKTCVDGCSDGACLNSYEKDCKFTCEGGTCEHAVCVTDEMKSIKTGEACDAADFVEFCQDGLAVYCSNGRVVRYDCGSEGGCSIVPNNANENKLVAVCRGNGDACSKDYEKQFFCTQDAVTGVYESFTECLLNTDNTYSAVSAVNNHVIGDRLHTSSEDSDRELPYALCDEAGCDDKKEHCANPQKYYLELNERGDVPGCSGTNAMYVSYNGEDGAFLGGRRPPVSSRPISCPGERICVQKANAVSCLAACEKEGTYPVCTDDEVVSSVQMTCEADDRGVLYFSAEGDSTLCSHGCGDDGACIKLITTEGSDCKDDYNECIDGDVHAFCQGGKIAAELCDSGKCDVTDGVAACVDSTPSCVAGKTWCEDGKFAECLKDGTVSTVDCTDSSTCQETEAGASCVAPKE